MILVALTACGGTWNPQSFEELHAGFPLDCAHAEAPCESCHDPSGPPAAIEEHACLSCHEPDRPASHDPVETATCSECHSTCSWDSTNPHPEGFVEPELHGLAFKLQDPSEGDCRDCHGERLDGGDAQSCDGCHTEEGIGDWRTDCVLCHGGENEPSGAPPADIDDQAPISFAAHTAHVDVGGDYRPTPCRDCHLDHADVLDDGHVFDATPAVAEVDFSLGLSDVGTFSGSSCSNLYCHGSGQVADGLVAVSAGPMDCESCHATELGWDTMSGVHAVHLEAGDIVCADCHAEIIYPGGLIAEGDRHVDGVRDVSLLEPTITTSDAGRTCDGSCHGADHTGWGWGHPPGYDAPEVHGQEALFVQQDCRSCHGADLLGGSSGQGCDDCHTAGWRSDCSYCHGSGSDGLPPEDLDNVADEDLITFKAHPEHADGDTHPVWGCETCHGAASASYLDALTDPDHWFDSSPGRADVAFTGLGTGATYNNGTCSSLYCHGDGRTDGSETDSVNALPCTGCHAMPPTSGQHRDHDHDNYPCAECHALTVDPADAIIGPGLHVDGTVDVDMNASLNSVTWSAGRCSGSCHGDGHDNDSWN